MFSFAHNSDNVCGFAWVQMSKFKHHPKWHICITNRKDVCKFHCGRVVCSLNVNGIFILLTFFLALWWEIFGGKKFQIIKLLFDNSRLMLLIVWQFCLSKHKCYLLAKKSLTWNVGVSFSFKTHQWWESKSAVLNLNC